MKAKAKAKTNAKVKRLDKIGWMELYFEAKDI